jgi:glyoxylase-like metal-dependent hydrolase (beta-lactamase superfamily II)
MDGLDHPFATPPGVGMLESVAPGVSWLRMPLPFRLNHINLWMLEDGDGVTLVDSGFATEETKQAWRDLLDGRRVNRIIVTHFHPDHIGTAGWLEQTYSAPVWMTEREFLWAYFVRNQPLEIESASVTEFQRRNGLNGKRLEEQSTRQGWYKTGVPTLPSHFHRVEDGAEIVIGQHVWRVMVTRGHASEQICLYAEKPGLLIAADQVLPRISPNIGVHWPQPDADPLSLFLTSLDRLAELPADTLVLPSHGLPFRGLRQRIHELKSHHEGRLAAILVACQDQDQTAADLLPVIFDRALDIHDMSFAMAEAVAHTNLLWATGRLTRTAGADGVLRFRSV